MSIQLSVLDQSPVALGGTRDDALRASVELARQADALGVTRYWVAEHHESPAFAGTSPEVLLGILLAQTDRMRVGSGGVLLPRHDPDKVAEDFRVLSALFPGRVDLGVGRAGGPAGDFADRVACLLGDLVRPGHEALPQVWLLGSGSRSAAVAAEWGTAFCFAHFLNPVGGMDALTSYRGTVGSTGQVSLAVRVFAADTAAKAERLASAYLLWRSRKDLGDDQPLPDWDTVRRHRWTSAELARADERREAIVFGEVEQVREELCGLARHYGVDELVVNTLTHDPADRLRCYQLLAEAFDLPVTAKSLSGTR